MKVEIAKPSVHLESVRALWRVNSATLGFLPEGAFEQYASEGTILVALDDCENCLGYLLYRISRGRVVVVNHLCVAAAARGQGVAKQLINHLKTITRGYLGIRLACRRDFEANRVWPNLGFRAQGSRQGRGYETKELTIWWFDQGHPDLFTVAARNAAEFRLQVVLDANVFFDLHSSTGADESKALLADWLRDSIELLVTDELFNEINRNENGSDRARELRLAHEYPKVACNPAAFEKAYDAIRSVFPSHLTESDRSDLRHLARTVASNGAQFFVTRDTTLIERVAGPLYDRYGVSVTSPANLICRLDELRRETEYEVRRLAGTLATIRRMSGDDWDLAQVFQASRQEETKSRFQQRLRQYLAEPERYNCLLAQDTTAGPMALVVYDRSCTQELHVPLLRVRAGSLAGTLARHFIFQAVIRAAEEQRALLRITDPCLDDSVRAALQEDFFVDTADGWLKMSFPVLESALSIARRIEDYCRKSSSNVTAFAEIASALQCEGITENALTMSSIERVLWPAKVADAALPTFVVPIRAVWADDLFDEQLANQTLFGAQIDLALNREGVYYRSKRFPGGIKAPGRILWYVSHNPRYRGTEKIRALSRLDEVLVGKASDLYKRFRRLGVYRWQDVSRATDGDPDREIMALRFSDTELFPNPVPSQVARELLGNARSHYNFRTPLQVSSRTFAEIYALGQQLRETESGYA